MKSQFHVHLYWGISDHVLKLVNNSVAWNFTEKFIEMNLIFQPPITINFGFDFVRLLNISHYLCIRTENDIESSNLRYQTERCKT